MNKTVSNKSRQPSATNSPKVAEAMQIAMDFEPNLLEQYPEFMDVVVASVYGCGRPLKNIAFDMDMSIDKLCKLLARKDPARVEDDKNMKGREMYLRAFPKLLKATGDTRPIQWLVLTFMRDPEEHRRQALAQLPAMIQTMQRLMSTVTGP